MKISTKTGDDGSTSLPSGERVEKSDPLMHFVGTLDELNAHLGLVRHFLGGENSKVESANLGSRNKSDTFLPTYLLVSGLIDIQSSLFEIGAGKEPQSFSLRKLEKEIENLETKLPELKSFILPGGCRIAAQLHIARTVCRRAERLSPTPSPYLNRLSDLLFLLARNANLASQIAEDLWRSES